MTLSNIRLDSAGIAEILKSDEVANLVFEVAEAVATNVETPDTPWDGVEAYEYDGGDRAAAAVTIRDVRGRIWQVNNGVLTRAAAAEGLEVTSE